MPQYHSTVSEVPETATEVPFLYAEAVTPNDSVDLPNVARSLYVGVTGNIQLITLGGNTVTFVGIQAGTVLPIRTSRVGSTGTTATNILALF